MHMSTKNPKILIKLLSSFVTFISYLLSDSQTEFVSVEYEISKKLPILNSLTSHALNHHCRLTVYMLP